MRQCLLVVLCTSVGVFGGEPAVARLKRDIYYLASDKLRGRGAGSHELERAAEFIARRFWSLGLQPGNAGGWFQAIPLRADTNNFTFRIEVGQSKYTLTPENAYATVLSRLNFSGAAVIKVDDEYLRTANGQPLEGKVVLAGSAVTATHLGTPAAILYGSEQAREFALTAPAIRPNLRYESPNLRTVTRILSTDRMFISWIESLPAGPVTGGQASGTATTEPRDLDLHNVIGVLPGSDPILKSTYVIVSAHYDGQGEAPAGTDRIRNSANDNASGTATVLAIAELISKMRPRPRRSIIFAAWSGEETGHLGSRFYAYLPLFPLDRTVANINIEQDGRYDGEGGSGPKRMLVTGYGYSELGRIMAETTKSVGVETYAGPNEYFPQSDNYSLAQVGIPAHSVGSSTAFPDHHLTSDSADKIDYENMALLTNAITAAVVAIANSDHEPQWSSGDPATASFRRAGAVQSTMSLK